MGCATKLSLLLLISSWASAQHGAEFRKSTTCLKQSTRFKNLKTFFYNYEAETSNGIIGTADSRSGVQIFCRLEIEVPQYCDYSMRINSCTLKEVHSISAEGKPSFRISKDNEEFQQAMSRYDLKFTTTHGHIGVTLFPNKNEPTNILNIKRGIISALLVPMESREDVQLVDMTTVYGNCTSKITVNHRANNLATHITIGRDLAQCNKFTPVMDHTSPLAMVSRMPSITSLLLSSKQSCSYSLDVKKHVKEAVCNEEHLFLPGSHKNKYGSSSLVKQTLKLERVTSTNSQYFVVDESTIKKDLTLEHVDTRAKNANSALSALQNLASISKNGQPQQRANLFQIFVAELRRLDEDTLQTALSNLLQIEKPRYLTFQALLQCGTPECFGTILKMLQSEFSTEWIADAVTYSVGLMASPTEDKIRLILNLAKARATRSMFYALSHTVRRFYNERMDVVPELKEVADYLMFIIGNECSGNEDKVYLALKALGNMGQAMENAKPEIMESLLSCVKSKTASSSVQQAAVQAFRQMALTDEVRNDLFEVYTDNASPTLKRLGAYLIVMKKPTSKHLRKIIKNLSKIEDDQVKSFVSSHLGNILTSRDPTVQELKSKLTDALKSNVLPSPMDFRKYSRNYKIYKEMNIPKTQNSLEGGLQSNIIFDPNTYLPRAVMLETTLNVFGQSVDLFEIGLEGSGLEPSLEAIFGSKGFFPNSAMKALYWVDGKVPKKVSQVLFKWFGKNRDTERPNEDLMKEYSQNFQKMLNKIEHQTPEVGAFLRVFGNELGYVKGSDFKLLKEMASQGFQLLRILPVQLKSILFKSFGSDLFAHYIFMDSQFNLPTGAGLPLKLSISGTVTPGTKAGMTFEGKKIKGLFKPEVATELVIQMGINVPNFARNGVQINYNMYFESGIEAEITMSSHQLKFNIQSPKEPVKLFSISNRLSLLHSTKIEVIPSIMKNRQEWRSCKPCLTGLNICASMTYSDASSMDNAPRYPLTGETRFVIEIEPTGTVTDYSASITYQSQKREEDLEYSLKFSLAAEGSENIEAATEIKYNINKNILTADVEFPKFDIEFGMKLAAEDKSATDRTSYVVRFDVTNKNIPEVTFKGRTSFNNEQRNLLLQGLFSIPQLDVKTNVGTQIRRLSDGLFTEFSLEASVPHFKASYQTNFRYDSKKVQVAWNSEATSNLKIFDEKISNMEVFNTFEYQKALTKHLDNFLEQKIAQTDMTLKHIIFKSIEASKVWLQKVDDNVPFVPTIQNHWQTLKKMDLEQIRSFFTLPETLFLKNKGSIAGTFGNNKVNIPVPIPFGGQVFEEVVLFPRTIKLSPTAKEVLGINSPSNDYTIPSVSIPLVGKVTSIPSVTIPKIFNLQFLLIDKLEFSSELNNNYYNWTSSFTYESNKEKIGKPFSADVHIKADSFLDYLSYQLKGSILSSQTREAASSAITGSFKHSLLSSSVKLSTNNGGSSDKSEVEFEWHTHSIGGARTSLMSSCQFGNGHGSNFEIQGSAKGTLDVSSFHSTWNYTMFETFNANKEGRGNSLLNFNSALLQLTNRMNNEFSGDGFTLLSQTDESILNLKNTIKVKLTNKKHELKCDTSGQSKDGDFISNIRLVNNNKGLKVENKLRGQMFNTAVETRDQLTFNDGKFNLLLNSTGKYNEIEATNKFIVMVSGKEAEVEHKWDVIYYEKQFHCDLAGKLNNGGLQLKSFTEFPGINNHGILNIGNGGLSAEVTSNVTTDPIKLQSRFSTTVQPSKATMAFDINDEKNNFIHLDINGKAGSSGIFTSSSYSGVILETRTSNNINFQLTKEKGLVLHTQTEAAYKDILFNHTNHFSFDSLVFSAAMLTDGHLASESLYQQNFKVTLQPFTISVNHNARFKYQQLDLTQTGQLLLLPFKIDLKGEFVGKHMANQVKQTYNLQCGEWKALLSANTNGKVQSNKINHKLNLEIVGLSAQFSSDASCKSKQLQFQNHVHSVAIPFIFTFEADTFAVGNVDHWGKHNGSLNNKFQMKAKPFAFALHHSYKGISEHSRNNQKLLQTLMKNTLNVILSPDEQSSTWKLEGQLNNNGYMQTINAYNNPDRIGIEIASETEVDFDFKISEKGENIDDPAEPSKIKILGNLQYDKNRNIHIFYIPFLEDMPRYFNSLKDVVLNTLDTIHNFLLNINVNHFNKKCKIVWRQVNDYVKEMNYDLMVSDMKERAFQFVAKYEKSVEQLNLGWIHLSNITVANMETFFNYLKEYDTLDLKKAIGNFTYMIVNAVIKIDQQYEITQKCLRIVTQMQSYLDQLALQDKGVAKWIQTLDGMLKNKLHEIQMQLQNLDLQKLADRVKEYVSSINFSERIDELKQTVNEFSKKINDFISDAYKRIQWVYKSLEFDHGIRYVNAKIQKIITAYELDTLVQKLLNETVKFINQIKVKEAIQRIITNLKDIVVKSYLDKVVEYINEVSAQIELYDFQKLIDKMNELLNKVIMDLKEFDYNAFVEQTNNWIQETRITVRDKIRELELAEKVESMTKYLQTIQSLITDYITQKDLNQLIYVMVDVLRSIAVNIHTEIMATYGDMIEDLHTRINRMNVYDELQKHWKEAVNYYEKLIQLLSAVYQDAARKIIILAKKNNLSALADQLFQYLEKGFRVPEMNLGLISVPTFEVSIRAFRQGQLVIPSFTVPLTNLTTPSYYVSLSNLKNISVPVRFEIPAIRVLNSFTIPAFTIDLETIKKFIAKTIHDLQNFEIPEGNFPMFPDVHFIVEPFPAIKIPLLDFSPLSIPDAIIPKVNLHNFMLEDMKMPEFQPLHIPHQMSVPAYGKLSGAFSITTPVYNLHTSVGIHNSTVVQSHPEYVAFITAKGTSDLDSLSFDLEAKAQLSAFEQNLLKLSENIRLDHVALTIDHKGTLNFTKPFVNGNADTLIKISSNPYTAEAKNAINIKIDKVLYTKMETNYQHHFNASSLQSSSQISFINSVETFVDEKSIASIMTTIARGKGSIKNYSDEGLFKGELKVNLDTPALIVEFTGSTDTKYLKMKQNLKTELFSSFNANLVLNAETTISHVGTSAMKVNGTADLASLEVKLIGLQNANLTGNVYGTVENSLTFSAEPFAISAKTNNKVNAKVSFPFSLPGKVVFLNNYELTLNLNEQLYSWQVNSRFNQYKYNHNIYASNNDENIKLLLGLNGDANLDFLRIPISIPDMSIPYSSLKTPRVHEYSLWENAGLKKIWRTTRQSFDASIKTEYIKNKDVHDFKFDLTPVYNQIGDLLRINENVFNKVRNTILNLSRTALNDRSQFNPTANDLQNFIHIPSHTIPILNAKVSPYRIPIPNFNFVVTREITISRFKLPIINFIMPSYTFFVPSFKLVSANIPDSLSALSFPKIKMPAVPESIKLPAMGNLTCDFSLKSSLVTFSAHAELFNQSDIVARYSVSSSSIFTSNFKAEGTTSLARRRRLKLATTISIIHEAIQGRHNSTLSLSWKNVDASMNTKANIKLPNLVLNFTHDLSGNMKSKPNVLSKASLDWGLLVPSVGTDLEGKAVHSLTLGDLASYFNLETLTSSQVKGSMSFKNKFSGELNNEASVYIGLHNVRSNVKLNLNSSAKTASGNHFNIAMNENLALEASRKRIFAVWEHIGNNAISLFKELTQGSQTSKATLELAPWSVTGNLNVKFNQPSSLWKRADVQHSMTLSIAPESQALKWNNNGHLHSISFRDAVEVLNNRTEIHLDLTSSLEGHVDFLKDIWLPVYERNLWDILKLNLTTGEKERQHLNVSVLIVCTKSEDVFLIPFPVQRVANGLKVNVPEMTLHLSEWVSNLLPTAGKKTIFNEITFPTTTIPLANIVVPSYKFHLSELKLPSVFITPQFRVPYTTFQVPSYTINFTDIIIPLRTNILPFEVSLPNLPTISFPEVNIESRFAEYNKIPYLEVTRPKFNVMISQYTVPKNSGAAKQDQNRDRNAKEVTYLEQLAMLFPSQEVEIPQLTLYLPLAVVFPAFKSFAGSINVWSPVYTTTWIVNVKSDQDKAETITATVDAISNSTLRFLGYKLEASATSSKTDDGYSLNGKYLLSHPDFTLNWLENYAIQHSRITTQLDVNIKSLTFTDFEIHWLGDNNRISASVSTPSTGLLGMKIKKKKPDVLYGKIYIHKPSSAEIAILESRVSLENTENVQLQFKWENVATLDLVEGTKERINKMTGAVYDCINKYHTEHLGIEINDISSKVKDLMKQNTNEAFTKIINGIKEVDNQFQSAADDFASNYQNMKDKAKQLYKRAAVEVAGGNYNKKIIALSASISNVNQELKSRLTDSIDAAINFLERNKFNVAGLNDTYTVQELYRLFIKQVQFIVEKFVQNVDLFVEEHLRNAIKRIEKLEVKISSTNTVINSSEIIHQLREFLHDVQTRLLESLQEMQKINIEKCLHSPKQYIQSFADKVASQYKDLENTNFEAVKFKIEQLYNDGVNSVYSDQLQVFLGNLKEHLLKLIQVSQNLLQSLIEKIQEGNIHLKSIQEKLYDNFLFEWTAKFIEINENLVQRLTAIIEYIKASPKLINARAEILKQEANQFVNISLNTFNEYYKIMQSEFQEDGRTLNVEHVNKVKENMKEVFAGIKKQASAYKRTFKNNIGTVFLWLDDTYASLIIKARKEVDRFIETCGKITEELFRLLGFISNELFSGMIVKRQPGEIVINIPHHLEWKSFDEFPHLKDGTLNHLNTTFIKGQQMIQRGTVRAWELILDYQKNKKLLEERKTKKTKSKI
ncbi:apolipoprotein B-100 [Narcine bancroftii]|uniref:apolipoprotein B-100 n=1 Tax=Narcine bancroftii TaxID=1343680 RepID=UPI003831E1F1